ncbi:MAG: type IV secretory system conjugative DNA transfer family protein [Acidimicrobiales bacterium]
MTHRSNMTQLPARLARLLGPPASPHQTSRPPGGGLYLGHGRRGPVLAGPEHHALILGPPRSGKTSRLVVPAVVCHRGAAVVTSTKADVLWATSRWRARMGTCWYFDPSGTTPIPEGVKPLGWSPLAGCYIWDQAVARAHVLASAARPTRTGVDAHWVERAQALLAPLLHAAALYGADLAAVLSWLHRRELVQPLSLLEDANARRAGDLLAGIAHTDSRELSGIFSTADGLLAAYRSDAALAMTRHAGFDPGAFAASGDTIYLVAPSATQAIHAPLVVAFLDQLRSAIYSRHPAPPVLFALDEVAQIAPLPDLPSTVAEGGSQGLVVLACLQDLSQARARWGAAAEGFLTLFTHKVVLPGIADLATLRAISALAGDVDVPTPSQTATNTLLPKGSTTWSVQRRPRLPPDQVAASPPGTAILITGTHLTRVHL